MRKKRSFVTGSGRLYAPIVVIALLTLVFHASSCSYSEENASPSETIIFENQSLIFDKVKTFGEPISVEGLPNRDYVFRNCDVYVRKAQFSGKILFQNCRFIPSTYVSRIEFLEGAIQACEVRIENCQNIGMKEILFKLSGCEKFTLEGFSKGYFCVKGKASTVEIKNTKFSPLFEYDLYSMGDIFDHYPISISADFLSFDSCSFVGLQSLNKIFFSSSVSKHLSFERSKFQNCKWDSFEYPEGLSTASLSIRNSKFLDCAGIIWRAGKELEIENSSFIACSFSGISASGNGFIIGNQFADCIFYDRINLDCGESFEVSRNEFEKITLYTDKFLEIYGKRCKISENRFSCLKGSTYFQGEGLFLGSRLFFFWGEVIDIVSNSFVKVGFSWDGDEEESGNIHLYFETAVNPKVTIQNNCIAKCNLASAFYINESMDDNHSIASNIFFENMGFSCLAVRYELKGTKEGESIQKYFETNNTISNTNCFSHIVGFGKGTMTEENKKSSGR